MTMTIDTDKTVQILGREYPVMLKDAPGMDELLFTVQLPGGDELAAPTLRGLREKAREFKEHRFSVPFTTKNGMDGTVTGFHATNKGKVLVKWANGKSSQEASYQLEGAMPQLSPEDHAELDRLIKEAREAKEAWDAFVAARRFPEGSVYGAAQVERTRKAGLA
jgi:hypothetical protein